MVHISQRNLDRLRDLSGCLAEIPDHTTLVQTVFSQLTKVIDGEVVGYSLLNRRVGIADAGSTAPRPWFHQMPVAELSRLMRSHPAARHIVTTGDVKPVRLSDMVRWTDWVRTRAYAEMMSVLGAPHQMVIPTSTTALAAYTINRSGRDFTDAERDVAQVAHVVLMSLHHRVDAQRLAQPARGRSAPRASLTPRERQLLTLLAQGLTAQAIGRTVGISHRTVRKHLENAYAKLGAHDRLLAVQRARDLGLLEDSPMIPARC